MSATITGITRMLGTFYAVGLAFPPSGDREAIAEAWHDMLADQSDRSLRWVAKKWQDLGHTRWPVPTQLRALIVAERNRLAEQLLAEQAEQGCARCTWTGSRVVIQHQLHLRQPLADADVDLLVGYHLSDDPHLHAAVCDWIEDHPKHGKLLYRSAVARCDCNAGARLGQYPEYREFLESTPPQQAPGAQSMRPVCARVYVTGTQRRYHPDDTQPLQQGGRGPVRWYSRPSPEEVYGPLRGPELRAVAAKGLQQAAGAAAQLAAAAAPDRYADERRRAQLAAAGGWR